MELPKSLLQAAIAGLVLATSTTACDKVPLLKKQDEHTDECINGCVDPQEHQADPHEYYCPPCGMG